MERNITKVLYSLFGLFAVLYVALIHQVPFFLGSIVKTLPALLLAGIIMINRRDKVGKLMTAGLVFSALGDFLLYLNIGSGEKYFIFGLLSFLVAHILYILAFRPDLIDKKSGRVQAVILGIIAIGMIAFLSGYLGELLIPVLVYILVILLMAVLSGFHSFGGWMLSLGACLFMASDSMIAINVFVFETPQVWATYFIMIAYYVAQYFISRPFISEEKESLL